MKVKIVNRLLCLLGIIFLISVFGCFDNSNKAITDLSSNHSNKRFLQRDNFKLTSVEDLQEFLTYDQNSYPIVSAHRGGPSAGYPENAIETFQNLSSTMPVMIECDVRLTKDSVLVLMHDESLSRTTDGQGKLSNHTLKELKALSLKDNDGELTKYKIPTLEEALAWGRGKVIFCLDIKPDVPYTMLSEVIEKADAKHYAIVITNSAMQARKMYNINPDIVLSISVKSEEDFRRVLGMGIPDTKLVAFVGTRTPSKSLVDLLHNHGIKVMLGTFGNLDKQAARKGHQLYADFVINGADIISTDSPLEAQKALDFYIRKRNLSSTYIK